MYYDAISLSPSGICEDCPDAGPRVLVAFGLAAAAALVPLAMWVLLQLEHWQTKYEKSYPKALVSCSRHLKSAWRMARALDLRPKLKIACSFYQIVTVIDSTYSVHMPDRFTTWMHVFSIVGLDLSALVLPSGCLASGFTSKLFITAILPVVLCIAPAPFELLKSVKRFWQHKRRGLGDGTVHSHDSQGEGTGTVWDECQRILTNMTPTVLVITFAFVPSVSSSIFAFRACDGFGIAPGEEHFFLRTDLSVQCYASDEHARITRIAVGFILLWPVGVPLLYAALLAVARKPILTHTPNRLSRATRFLHEDYTAEHYYYELIELIRRTILTGQPVVYLLHACNAPLTRAYLLAFPPPSSFFLCPPFPLWLHGVCITTTHPAGWVLLVNESRAFLRIIIAVLVCVAALILTLTTKPYRHIEDQIIAVSGHAMLVIIFTGAGYVKAFEGARQDSTP